MYIDASTYISSRAFPSKLLTLPKEGSSGTKVKETSPADVKDEESHPLLLPGLDLLNRASIAFFEFLRWTLMRCRFSRTAYNVDILTLGLNLDTLCDIREPRFDTKFKPGLQQLWPQIE